MSFLIKASFWIAVVTLVATVAPPLSGSAKTQNQKRQARAAPKPTPTPSPNSVPANSTKTPGSSAGEDEPSWAKQSIKSLDDARRAFEAMDGSVRRMLRDYPDRWGEYFGLKIDKKQENQWRRGMIAKLSDQALNPATDANELWWLHHRLEEICQALDDAESVLKIYEVTRRIADRVPIQDAVMVAQTINGPMGYSYTTGRPYHTYKTGLIYLAVKHGLRDVAQAFADYSMSLAQRAKSSKVDVEGAELAMESCLAIKSHFGLR